MRVNKDPSVRRNEIMDVASVLFAQKGFDGATTNDILEKAGIARGTLYYHFKTKEDIMDALIERENSQMLEVAKGVATDKRIPVPDRMIAAVLAMNSQHSDKGGQMLEHMHKPQNALMHRKVQKAIIEGITPILADIVREGIEEGVFQTPFPYETMEMAVTYATVVFDNDSLISMTPEEELIRAQAFMCNLERLLGARDGILSSQLQLLLGEDGGGNDPV